MPDKIITPDRQLRSIIRRLEALELEHLRRHTLQQEERIEALQHELQNAYSEADCWRRDLFELNTEMAEQCGQAICLTKDGHVGVIDRRQSLIHRIAALAPEAGEVDSELLSRLVVEARDLADFEDNKGVKP